MFYLAVFVMCSGYVMHRYIGAITGRRTKLITITNGFPILLFFVLCFIISRPIVKETYFFVTNAAEKVSHLPWDVFLGKLYHFLF